MKDKQQTYQIDISALANWQAYFTRKVHSLVLRDYALENIEAVSIRMLGDISNVRLEEHLVSGGFVYELLDSVADTTLEVTVMDKTKGVFTVVVQAELPLKVERKRTATALGEQILSEIERFKKMLESQGNKLFDVHGSVISATTEGTKFFLGDAGAQAFHDFINRKPQPKMTALTLIELLSIDVMQPYNDRGVRIVERFRLGAMQELIESKYRRFKVCNGVPVYLLASANTKVYLAPTFCIFEQGEKLHILYSLEKGNSIEDASKVFAQLKLPLAEPILKAMDLRRG